MLGFFAAGLRENRHFASRFVAMIAIGSVYLDPQIHQTCSQIYRDWQQLYVDHLVRFGYEETVSRQKAQALFALVHGTILPIWRWRARRCLRSLGNADVLRYIKVKWRSE